MLWLRDSLFVIRDRAGRPRGLRGLMTDITARKQAEQAAHLLADASKALPGSLDYETTLDTVAHLAVPDFADLCVVDIVEAGDAIRRVAIAQGESPAAELVRRIDGRHLVGDADDPIVRVIYSQQSLVFHGGARMSSEQGPREPQGLAVPPEFDTSWVAIVPVIARGRTLGAITCAITDSSRQFGPWDVALFEELGRRAGLAIDNARLYLEAQRAVRVREDFLAAASHELRTPLTTIKGFASTLRQPDVAWDEASRQEFLTEIEQRADELGKLITDLLDASRLESGGLGPRERTRIRPASLVKRGVDRVRGLLEERRIILKVARDLPPILVDAVQIERVIANLVENAAKYSPPRTSICINGGVADGELELRVEDEGPGIPPEDLDRVFEKFFRSRSGESSIPGTGLGLAISRRIVEGHGGRIWAENRQEGGARLIVRLPLGIAVRWSAA